MKSRMERRGFPRLRTQINARILVNNRNGGEGIVFDLSAGGVGVHTDLDVNVDDCIIMQLSGGRRFKGNVSRLFGGGFAVEFNMTETKQSLLANSIEPQLQQEDEITELRPEHRTATRATPLDADVACHTDQGAIKCTITDMSLAGAAIKCRAHFEIGDIVTLGTMRGKVVHSNGDLHGIEFITADGDVATPSIEPASAGQIKPAKQSA